MPSLWLAALVLILDQASKFWAVHHLEEGARIAVTPFFNWVLVFNSGAAFSLFSEASGWQRPFFISITLILLTVLFIWLKRTQSQAERLALSAIIGGALGNLIDRLRLGEVVDFLDFHWQDYHWPAFNLADTAISLGVMVLLFLELRK